MSDEDSDRTVTEKSDESDSYNNVYGFNNDKK